MTKTDWHPADIIAALHKRGTSLAAVSREAGLSSSTLANALTRPWPKGELLIAHAIGVDAAYIWPGRYYDSNGRRIDRESLLRCHSQPATETA
ncbi:TPA: transcriptional regulator [Salmonella enterica]|uniref:Transcriptional regulator n=1 Tax=Salmonella enterica TaxID=28901 RepID=A0A762Z3W6_SALER|nr:transcriptional regulator [Salmonella enterica]HAF4932900.1 transcriptional regulator [Salmonella enterica]HAF5250200.1 transcriptional regulator [Salmonella enterica]HAF5747334.1 transcriptional regulator [Salmonella enterica]HAG3489356.1 transcriptional regulator [Salmonella enterica]